MLARYVVKATSKESGKEFYVNFHANPDPGTSVQLKDHPPDATVANDEEGAEYLRDLAERYHYKADDFKWKIVKIKLDWEFVD